MISAVAVRLVNVPATALLAPIVVPSILPPLMSTLLEVILPVNAVEVISPVDELYVNPLSVSIP